MDIWIHGGRGHYIGSAVIVRAPTLPVASELIRAQLDERGLADEPLNIRLVPADQAVIYVDDGDY